ncbi:NAD(P)-dependent oxidoreductase [Cryobacterium sp. SO2]|uniref:NAD(P)-dependent oxidoreductase n=1 Tax=Cryobacterium sp. SO2 TaxID=1897060 RepID=UPI00223DB40A|nr:NAD(P)-dependent oxidoreductase [Cryobacterium sp. SO2]WEO76031.1 NAD(P)-dependent oxidoreductase [Cryobacterium sp. SO2]
MIRQTLPRPTVSLVGLGPMGRPMAGILLARYGPVIVWNRSAGKSEALESRGAVVALTPAEAATEVTLTVLPDLPQVEGLLAGPDGLLAGWSAKRISAPVLVVHGTVSPIAIADFAQRMKTQHGVQVVDAPLSGGTVGAETGTLSIMIGGETDVVERLRPVFALLGTTIRHLGPSGSGAMAKACNQIVVAATVAAVSESMLLARTAGLDLDVVRGILQGGLAHSEVLKQKGDKWITEDFSPGGSATNQLKDLRFVAEAAEALHLTLPTTTEVTRLFTQMVADGDGALDHTGVYLTIAKGRNERP